MERVKKAFVVGLTSLLKVDESKPWEVLLCINSGDDFLYKHNTGENLLNMLISFVDVPFLEFLDEKIYPHFEFKVSILTASFDKWKSWPHISSCDRLFIRKNGPIYLKIFHLIYISYNN